MKSSSSPSPATDKPDGMSALGATSRAFFRLLVERFVSTHCIHVAGSLTFTTLLALVPTITLSLIVFSNFPAFSELGHALSGFLQSNVLPDAASQIAEYAVQFSERAANLTLIGTIMLIVTVLLLMSTIEESFNEIWGVSHPRPLVTRIAVYWVALTIGPIALAASIFASGQIVATSIAYMGDDINTRTMAATIVPYGLIGLLFSLMYLVVPNHPVRFKHALIGGFMAAFVFMSMQRLFGLFIALSPSYTLVYGTFAAIPIFLVWLYASWVIVLVGAIFSATFPTFIAQKQAGTIETRDRAWAATAMLVCLARGLSSGKLLDFETLQRAAGSSVDQAERLLGELHEAGWISFCDDDKWVLRRHPDTLSLLEIIKLFALSPERWLASSAEDPGLHHGAKWLNKALSQSNPTLAELAYHQQTQSLAQAGDATDSQRSARQ